LLSSGVGKGRTIAGIIYDRFYANLEARKESRGPPFRCLWVSVSWELRLDAENDLKALRPPGSPKLSVWELRTFHASENLSEHCKSGVLFATYSSLAMGSANKGADSRLQQILAWLAGGQDGPAMADEEEEGYGRAPRNCPGVMVFDEAHRAKNLVPAGRFRGKTAEEILELATKTGRAVATLQDRLPACPVVYSSATSASEIRHFGYMTRLGLWNNKVFDCFQGTTSSFKEQLEGSGGAGGDGMSAMEMVAVELKGQGKYVSRNLSFQGTVFEVKEVQLMGPAQALYDECTDVWFRFITLCHEIPRLDPTRVRRMSLVWALHQAFFRQLLSAIKTPHAIEAIARALEANQSVVVGLQLTGEARTKEAIKDLADAELESFISAPREGLLKLIRQFCPIDDLEEQADEEEEEEEGEENAMQRAKRAWRKLFRDVRKLALPTNALDALIDHFGPKNVAEITGRSKRVLQGKKGRNGKTEFKYDARDSGKNSETNNAEREAFLDGKKRIIICSSAGSAGISLHAGLQFRNQQQRVLLQLELPWSSDAAVQMFGRVHRSNQAHSPIFVVCKPLSYLHHPSMLSSYDVSAS
jgi:hypothetical protein